MEKITATQTLQDKYLPDRRRQRVDALVHATMDALDKFIADDDRKAAYYALVDLFTSKGIDILTAEDRERIGLPPHNEKGWTDQEVRALEVARMEMLIRPMPILSQLVKDETEKRFGMSPEEKKEDDRRQGSRFRIREGNTDG